MSNSLCSFCHGKLTLSRKVFLVFLGFLIILSPRQYLFIKKKKNASNVKMFEVSPHPLIDVYGPRFFLFHIKTYMPCTYIIFNLQKWNNDVDSVQWLAFLTSQSTVDTIHVFSKKRESRNKNWARMQKQPLQSGRQEESLYWVCYVNWNHNPRLLYTLS